jgi:hypothetical protein
VVLRVGWLAASRTMRQDLGMDDPRIEKWRRWFEKGITNDVYTMHLQRSTWKRMEEIVNANPALRGTESICGNSCSAPTPNRRRSQFVGKPMWTRRRPVLAD